MLDDFHGFSDAAGIPSFDAGDEFSLAPVDLMVFSVGVLDYRYDFSSSPFLPWDLCSLIQVVRSL